MKCPKCGYNNKDGSLYCNLCYEVLRKERPAEDKIADEKIDIQKDKSIAGDNKISPETNQPWIKMPLKKIVKYFIIALLFRLILPVLFSRRRWWSSGDAIYFWVILFLITGIAVFAHFYGKLENKNLYARALLSGLYAGWVTAVLLPILPFMEDNLLKIDNMISSVKVIGSSCIRDEFFHVLSGLTFSIFIFIFSYGTLVALVSFSVTGPLLGFFYAVAISQKKKDPIRFWLLSIFFAIFGFGLWFFALFIAIFYYFPPS